MVAPLLLGAYSAVELERHNQKAAAFFCVSLWGGPQTLREPPFFGFKGVKKTRPSQIRPRQKWKIFASQWTAQPFLECHHCAERLAIAIAIYKAHLNRFIAHFLSPPEEGNDISMAVDGLFSPP